MDADVLSNLRQELRRGSLVLICLLALRRPEYGYALLKVIEDAGLETDANTLYPLLRRLEKQGLVVSEWVTDPPRPRRFYRTSPAGEQIAGLLMQDWAAISATLDRFKRGSPT